MIYSFHAKTDTLLDKNIRLFESSLRAVCDITRVGTIVVFGCILFLSIRENLLLRFNWYRPTRFNQVHALAKPILFGSTVINGLTTVFLALEEIKLNHEVASILDAKQSQNEQLRPSPLIASSGVVL